MKVFFRKIAVAAAVVVVTAAIPATAATVDLNGSAAGRYKRVKVTAPSIRYDKVRVNAGAYDMTDVTPAPDNVLGDFVAFCLDLAAWIGRGTGYEYKVTDTPFSNSVDLISNGGVQRIQAIFDANYSNAVATESKLTSAAFQVALWNAVYDDDWSATSGSGFSAKSRSSGVIDQANAYLAAAQNYTGDKKWRLSFLESTAQPYRYQNLVAVAPVPLPAAGFMLLGALAGFGLLRRRRSIA
ncbi:VPLPA-CTERM sorting domain-containing protein [Ruegeria atlantica]|uniref:VPLPA-CTERM protein sorting domain protein n=1 Tax=Ruegeria atlantica TaxID=81569 RepID=A0A0P1EG98_9RHOB|nr:VPLPA-CTERM sorting domain-containing protein [Ruegeria atlantica]CUH49057.1 VPLPA-CTERM protein sorting domain protein [Ruegeria atlantica]